MAAMTDDEVIVAFCDLFEGNPSRYGTEEGGSCINHTHKLQPLVELHLRGTHTPIGVYPIRDSQVKWGCVDFDEGDEESLIHARNVQLVLNEFGVHAYIERSRSKGCHVWVFADSWVSAGLMRDALLAACEFVDAPTKEINPKQYELKEGQVGSYVRLPYPAALANSGITEDLRRVVISPSGHIISLRAFVRDALAYRLNQLQLEDLSHFYKPARIEPTIHAVASNHYSGDAYSRLKGYTKVIYLNGPLDGSDRSSALWKLGCLLAEDGRHTYEEALDLLTEADAKWGKFLPRADGELRLNELLVKAWKDRANGYGAE